MALWSQMCGCNWHHAQEDNQLAIHKQGLPNSLKTSTNNRKSWMFCVGPDEPFGFLGMLVVILGMDTLGYLEFIHDVHTADICVPSLDKFSSAEYFFRAAV